MKDRLQICTKEQNKDKNFVPCEHCTRREKKCTDYSLCHIENKCAGGYWVKARKKRPGKYERLLKSIITSKGFAFLMRLPSEHSGITDGAQKELNAIRKRMAKGGGK
jgi:phage terminase large subunit-like protein